MAHKETRPQKNKKTIPRIPKISGTLTVIAGSDSKKKHLKIQSLLYKNK